MADRCKAVSFWKFATVACVIAAPLAAWTVSGNLSEWGFFPMSVTGTIQAKEIPVASKIGGRIARVLVQEGQTVVAGQTLVEFEEPELEARRDQVASSISECEALLRELKNGPRRSEIEKARAAAEQALANWQMLQKGYRAEEKFKAQSQRREAERNLALLESGYRREEVEQARAVMDESRVKLQFAEKDWRRYEDLVARGAVSARETEDLKTKWEAAREAFKAAEATYEKMRAGPRVDEINAARERLNYAKHHEEIMLRGPRAEEIAMARQQYLQAQATLALLEQGTRQEEIDQAQARLRHSQATLAELNAQLREKEIVAPCVAEVSVMDLHAGEVIPANKTVATLTRLDDIWTRVYVPERQLSRVHIGQDVQLKVDCFPSVTFTGKVVQIPGVAEFTPRNVQTPEERSAQVFGVKIRIDNSRGLLRGGMNAEIRLPRPATGKRRIVAGDAL